MNTSSLKNILRPVYGPVLRRLRENRKSNFIKHDVLRVRDEIMQNSSHRIFYLGITAHSNLGDMAQYYCIHRWIEKNFPDSQLIEIEADTVVDERYGFLKLLSDSYRKDDIIVFQSGYTTQDLGGVHDLMHRMVIESLPDAHILMMPQTIYFVHEENKQRSAEIYNRAHSMLFLARDEVSYGTACEMMPDVSVKLYPDIVTSLIGTFKFSNSRHGVCLCRRNDGEKYYSDEQLDILVTKLKKQTSVTITDTTIKVPFPELRNNRQKYIEEQIEYFSHFEAVITDRYHGTIFALAAGTPVIIIKTTDHKVVTGADWFKGVYDDYVQVADSLDEAYGMYNSLKGKKLDYKLAPYFEEKYYSNLKNAFSQL